MGQRIHDITLTRVDVPMIRPDRLSYRTFECFEPILVRTRTDDGADGWGEFNGYVKIRPGSGLLKTPLPFDAGTLTLAPGWWPEIDLDRVAAHHLAEQRVDARISAHCSA